MHNRDDREDKVRERVCRPWAAFYAFGFQEGPEGTAEPCSGSTPGMPSSETSGLTVILFCLMRGMMRGRWCSDGEHPLVTSIWVHVCVCVWWGVIVNSFACVTFSSHQNRLQWRKTHRREQRFCSAATQEWNDLTDQAGTVDFSDIISRVRFSLTYISLISLVGS